MAKGWCVECGSVYNETPHSFLCPGCRKKKASEGARKNAKSINLSALGNAARKAKGGKENDD